MENGILIKNLLFLSKLWKINHNNQLNVCVNLELFKFHDSICIFDESIGCI